MKRLDDARLELSTVHDAAARSALGSIVDLLDDDRQPGQREGNLPLGPPERDPACPASADARPDDGVTRHAHHANPIIAAAAPFINWWTLLNESERSMTGAPIKDQTPILQFVGSAGSATVNAGHVRTMLNAMEAIGGRTSPNQFKNNARGECALCRSRRCGSKDTINGMRVCDGCLVKGRHEGELGLALWSCRQRILMAGTVDASAA